MKYLSSNGSESETLSKMITVCKKTGLQSSEGLSEGKYKFFINATNDETKWTNKYLFDGEHLILNTGGQSYSNYINDKFSTMSDCLILKPRRNAISIYYWLKANEERINRVGFQGTGLRHLDPNWLMRQKISIINFDETRLSKMNEAIDKEININNQYLTNLKMIKNGLLNAMFI